MPPMVKKGVPVVGVLFLALALFKALSGQPWVVWAILGFLFGGFGIFATRGSKGDGA